jgi:membrane protease YdiL (CAAX protease family)
MPSPSQNFTRRVYHGDRGHPYRDDPAVAAIEALALYTAAVAVFVLVGAVLGPGLSTLAAAQVIGLAGPPVAWAIARGDAVTRLGLAAPPARAVIGALLIGATFWYVNGWITAPLVERLDDGGLRRFAAELSGPPFALQLLLVAALPAICEELLNRGLLARALRPALGRVLAVLISAALFAALHMSPARFPPMLLFGAVLATLTLAADSLWPAVVAHVVNNAIALAISDRQLPSLAAWLEAHELGALAVAGLASAAGIVIALAPRRAT